MTGISSQQPYTVHWDGAAWSPVLPPSPGTSGYLSAVDAITSTDIWAAGFEFEGPSKLFVEHSRGCPPDSHPPLVR